MMKKSIAITIPKPDLIFYAFVFIKYEKRIRIRNRHKQKLLKRRRVWEN